MNMKTAINIAMIFGAMVSGGIFVKLASEGHGFEGLLASAIIGAVSGMIILGALTIFLSKDEKDAIRAHEQDLSLTNSPKTQEQEIVLDPPSKDREHLEETVTGYKLEKLETAAKFENNCQWNELLEFSNQWVVEEPKNIFAWQSMGEALRKLERPAEAISVFRKGLEFAPPYPVDFMGKVLSAAPLWYRLAHAYSELGKADLSIEAFKEAARIDPMAADIWNDLGVAYVNNNNHEAAFESFKKAVNAEPTNTNSLKNLGIFYATCGIEQGVTQVHQMLLNLDANAARDFLVQAQQLLSIR